MHLGKKIQTDFLAISVVVVVLGCVYFGTLVDVIVEVQ